VEQQLGDIASREDEQRTSYQQPIIDIRYLWSIAECWIPHAAAFN
jgi:hypothetical protein